MEPIYPLMAFCGFAAGLAASLWRWHEHRAAKAFALASVICGALATWWEVSPDAPTALVALAEGTTLGIALAVWVRAAH